MQKNKKITGEVKYPKKKFFWIIDIPSNTGFSGSFFFGHSAKQAEKNVYAIKHILETHDGGLLVLIIDKMKLKICLTSCAILGQ